MAEDIKSENRPIVTRAEAKAAGLVRYFTGRPCPKGHVDERQVSSKDCLECNRARARKNYDPERYRQYADKNREKIAERQKKYDAKRDNTKRRPTTRAWQAKNRDWVRERRLVWEKENPGAGRAATKRWRDEHPEQVRATGREWTRNNPEKVHSNIRNQRAKRRLLPGKHTAKEISALLSAQNGLCANPNCAVSILKKRHVDHIMPMKLGGSNWIDNLQLLCNSCNLKKGSKHPLVWALENGLIFWLRDTSYSPVFTRM